MLPMSPSWRLASLGPAWGFPAGLKWPPAEVKSAAEQSPNSWMWNPWLPAARPVTVPVTRTPPASFLKCTVPATLLSLPGMSTAMPWVAGFSAAKAAAARTAANTRAIAFMAISLLSWNRGWFPLYLTPQEAGGQENQRIGDDERQLDGQARPEGRGGEEGEAVERGRDRRRREPAAGLVRDGEQPARDLEPDERHHGIGDDGGPRRAHHPEVGDEGEVRGDVGGGGGARDQGIVAGALLDADPDRGQQEHAVQQIGERDHGNDRSGRAEGRVARREQREQVAAEDGDPQRRPYEEREDVAGHPRQRRLRVRAAELRVDEGSPGRLEGRRRELHALAEVVAHLVEADLAARDEQVEDLPVGQVLDLQQQPVGHLRHAEAQGLAEERNREGGRGMAHERRQQREREHDRRGEVAPEDAAHPPARRHQHDLEHDVHRVPCGRERGEERGPVLDPQQGQRHERERARGDVRGHEHDPRRRHRRRSEEPPRDRPGRGRHRRQQQRAHAGGEEGDGAGERPAFLFGLELVVDAEEAGVEAEAEDDLGEGAEEDQQGDVAVVDLGQEARVERDQQQVDDVGEDVGGAVDGGVRRELAEVGEQPRSRTGSGQTRPLSEVKYSMTRSRISSRWTFGSYPVSARRRLRSGTRRGMSSKPSS